MANYFDQFDSASSSGNYFDQFDPGAKPKKQPQQGYLSAAAEAGGRSLLAAGARIIDELNPFTLSESDAATLFKDNPAKLKELTEKSASMALSRYANEQTARAREVMQKVSPTETGAISGKPLTELEYATLDPEKAAYLSPTRVAGDVLQSMPTTLALAVSAYLTKGAATRSAAQAEAAALAKGAGTAEAKAAARQAAIDAGAETMAKTGALGEGAIGYAQQMNQSMMEGLDVKPEVYETSPQYKDLLSKGYAPEAARRQLAADSAREAGLFAGAVDAGTNLIGGRLLGKVIGEGGKLGARAAKGFGTEAITETLQSAGEQFGANLAARNLVPGQDLLQGVGEAAAAGAVVGGVTGGGTSAIFGGGRNEGLISRQRQLAEDHLKQSADAGQAAAAADALSGNLADIVTSELAPAVNEYLGQRAAAPVSPLVTQQQMVDRNAELVAQANQAGTSFDRDLALAQAATALPAAQPGAATGYADLTPMNPMQAQQRLGVMQDMAAQEGGDALSLAIVPHPAQEGAFAIAQQPVPSLELPPTEQQVTPLEAQARIEQAALTGKEGQRQAEDQPRQIVIDAALRRVEERGGVASPAEARIFQEANLGKPYDRIDESLAPPLTTDERLTQATGIPLTGAPRETVVPESRRVAALEQSNAEGLAAQQARVESNRKQAEQQTQQQIEEANKPAPLPAASAVISAYQTAPPLRTAEQKVTLDQAKSRMDQNDLGILQKAAQSPMLLSATDKLRLTELRNPTPAAPEVVPEVAPEPGLMGTRVASRLGLPSEGRVVTAGATLSTQRNAVPGATLEINDGVDESGAPVTHTITVVDTKDLGAHGMLLNQVSRIFGKKLVAFTSDTLAADGFVMDDDNGTIHINAKTQISPLAVFGHELTHLLKRDNVEAYNALQTVVQNTVTDEGMKKFNAEYGRGANIEELTSDLVGNRFQETGFWKDVFNNIAEQHPEKAQSIITRMSAALQKGINAFLELTRQPSFQADQYVSDLQGVKTAVRQALVTYAQQQRIPASQLEAQLAKAQVGIDLTAGSKGPSNARLSVAPRNENIPGAPAQGGRGFSEDGGGPTPTYGTARQGAISVVGRHYSATPRQSLSGAFYGQGLKGAERDRLDRSTDPRLKNRVYFYVDQGAGIRPESGVGGYAHETRLDNIYDPQTRIIKPQADFNAFESAVINAGFDGYIAPFGNGQSAVVLLGQKHKAVPVKAIGQPRAAAPVENAPPSVLKKGLMSKELSQIDTSNIPGARVRAGSLEIPAEQIVAANTELERIGSEARFSKQRNEEEPLAKAVKAEGAKATAVVSAKPGREFKIGNDTASIVTYPKANDLEFVTSRLHARVREALTGSDATNFLAATFGLKSQSLKNLTEIRGLWNTEREDTFAITASKADGSPADFEDSRKLANLLGFAFIQEGAVTIEPSHKSNESIPSVLIGKPDGSKLTRSEIDSALSAANDAGFFGASEALSGKGVKFLFFADDSSSKSTEDQYRDFVDQIATVQKSTGLTAAGNFNTNSRLDGANEYWTNATGQSLSENIGGAGNQTASGEPSNIFRGTVDSLLAPYISALSTEGFKFDIKQWQRVFGATDAQSSYLKLKLAELDNVNKHGVVPKLRQQVPITNLKQVGSKALITQKTTEANATEQLAALDKVLAGSSNPVKNTEAWLRMEAMAYGTNDVPMAPNRFIKMYNGDGIYEQLKSLSPGQVSDAQQGAEMGQEFRALYESGKVSPAVTAKLMLWSFLSRGVSPYVQESAFVDLVDKIDPFIPRVLNGTFSDDDAAAWNKIVAQTISKGSGQPGAATTHNANAFGGSFMRGMAAAAPNGRTKMQYLHELFSDPTKSGPEIRREFIKMGEGVGIDNKVISFTLLVIGHDDVIVLDRVQIANTFNDGRLGDYNLYDGVSRYGYKDAAGKTVWLGVTPADYAEAKDKAGDDEVISAKLPGSGMANLTTGARGLMIYEPLEGALQKVLPGIFDRLKADGLRSADTRPSVGRWHWEGWVAYSGQEASHKTLEALLAEAKGEKNPFADVSAKEGEYGAFSYGTEYARDINGTAYKLYFDSKGVPYRFTLDSYKTLMSELKKKGKDGVVPGNFKVSTNEDGTQRSAPWFKDPRVNLAKFDEMIHRLGTANIKASPTRQTETAAIFAGLEKRGLAKTKAETALAEHPDSEKLKYVQDNFLDILSELDDSGLVEINC